MSTLVPCLACNRHVRSGEVCPFCGAPSVETSASPLTRASRAALLAIATAACGGAQVDVYGGPPPPQPDASAPAAQPTVVPPQSTPKQ